MGYKKAIYGLKQSALAWWKVLDKSMATLSCTHFLSDSGIFVNKDKTIVIIVYIDDVLFVGANKKFSESAFHVVIPKSLYAWAS